jgi:gamma-glutamylcyclotransferase (GGCT)/AIG2-like uncharacterized protein YtfP
MKYYYFGYGMNTNIDSMARRCPSARSLGSAVVNDWQFRFAYHADVVPKVGARTVGVLWEITDECLSSLDILEGYPSYYQRKIVPVTYRNRQYDSIMYYMMPGNQESPPPQNYWKMLMEGYIEHNVSRRQLWTALENSCLSQNEIYDTK